MVDRRRGGGVRVTHQLLSPSLETPPPTASDSPSRRRPTTLPRPHAELTVRACRGLSHTEEGRASLCHLCGETHSAQHQHDRGELHTEREDGQNHDQSASTRQLSSADVEAALVAITRRCLRASPTTNEDADIEEDVV